MEKIGCMFAGQGAQTPGMGAAIARENAAARRIFELADARLGYGLSEICFNGTMEQLTPCAVCQPAIFIVSMAVHAAWLSEHDDGMAPSICAGLSLGEFSAACAAGVFDFETGIKLVAERGRLMDDCCRRFPGGMAAVLGGKVEDIEAACQQADVDVANYNCPGQIVISGRNDALDKACGLLEGKVLRTVKLNVAGAYHSRLMKPAAEAFAEVLGNCPLEAPRLLFAQNVAGGIVADPSEIRRNLQLQVAFSVRWEQCARTMMEHSQRLLEFGPGNVLCGFMKRIDRAFPAEIAIKCS
ncbi:MAG: ACP S-malonyltransferase [Victivallales bacterium]|nr:ACP S-malonyltransferase [Victivallales bacterium]